MKYYIFSRYRQTIDSFWIKEQLKTPYYYWGAFDTLKKAKEEYFKIWKKGGLDFLDSDYGIFSVDEKGEWFRYFNYKGENIEKRRLR